MNLIQNCPKVRIIADSISIHGHRLTTFEVEYWRSIHAELMTHRAFSRNAGSSRAMPALTIIENCKASPWGPVSWGKNQPGMQAGEHNEALVQIPHHLTMSFGLFAKAIYDNEAYLGMAVANRAIHVDAPTAWHFSAWLAGEMSGAFNDAKFHKQIVNRITEPYSPIKVLITATDFANFFALRDHPDAQPEIQQLAKLMKLEYERSEPMPRTVGEWHMPYIGDGDYRMAYNYLNAQDRRYFTYTDGSGRERTDYRSGFPKPSEVNRLLLKISVARCARVSYKAFDGTVDIEKDLKLFKQLVESQPVHASPTEHQAMVLPEIKLYTKEGPENASLQDPYSREPREFTFYGEPGWWSNFTGWGQYRKTIPNETVKG